jgi:hypothetical protein
MRDAEPRVQGRLSRKPLHVPLAHALDILDNQLERIKVQRGDGVEGDVQNNQRPLEEGVDGVGCAVSRGFSSNSLRKQTKSSYLPAHGEPCAG